MQSTRRAAGFSTRKAHGSEVLESVRPPGTRAHVDLDRYRRLTRDSVRNQCRRYDAASGTEGAELRHAFARR